MLKCLYVFLLWITFLHVFYRNGKVKVIIKEEITMRPFRDVFGDFLEGVIELFSERPPRQTGAV